MNVKKCIAGTAVALTMFGAVSVAASSGAHAAPASLTTTVSTVNQSGINFADGDQILGQLRHELSSNQDQTRWIEQITGMRIEEGYRAHELTFRELGYLGEDGKSSWLAVFTYVLVDPAGDDAGGARGLYLEYKTPADREVTTDAEAFSGDAELTLTPGLTFARAEKLLLAHLQEERGTEVELDNVVLRKPNETPHHENPHPLYVVHVAGDSLQEYYYIDTVTGEMGPMEM